MNHLHLMISSEAEMERLGKELACSLVPGDRVLLSGVLGAGKTTLTRGLARGLGYQGRVSSPTFTLMNIYQGDLPVYHLDFYRLEDQDWVEGEWDEPLYGDGVTIVEWPPPTMDSSQALVLEIELMDNDYDRSRQVKLSVPPERNIMLERLKNSANFGS